MLLYPKSTAAEHSIGSIIKGQGNPGSGWVECNGADYVKSSYPEYVANCVDLHPLRFQKYKQLSFTNTPNVQVKSVAINGNTIVMVGGTTRYHWRSTDGGDNWTEYSTNLPSSQDWRIVRYDNSQYIAVAYGSTALAYSSDGITWNSVTLAASGNWTHLVWNGSIWLLAAQNSSTCFTSSNGSTWTQRTITGFDESGIAVDRVNNEFMINGTTASYLYIRHSTDGINWTTKESETYQGRPYDTSLYYSNIMYFPDSDKWMMCFSDNYSGPASQWMESYDDGDTWNNILVNGRWPEYYNYFQDGTLWDGNCHIWFYPGTYMRGYYMMDGNSFINFSGPGYQSLQLPTSFDAEFERFMICPSYESAETTFDYVWKYFYGDYDPQTNFCVPNLNSGNHPGVRSYIKLS